MYEEEEWPVSMFLDRDNYSPIKHIWIHLHRQHVLQRCINQVESGFWNQENYGIKKIVAIKSRESNRETEWPKIREKKTNQFGGDGEK